MHWPLLELVGVSQEWGSPAIHQPWLWQWHGWTTHLLEAASTVQYCPKGLLQVDAIQQILSDDRHNRQWYDRYWLSVTGPCSFYVSGPHPQLRLLWGVGKNQPTIDEEFLGSKISEKKLFVTIFLINWKPLPLRVSDFWNLEIEGIDDEFMNWRWCCQSVQTTQDCGQSLKGIATIEQWCKVHQKQNPRDNGICSNITTYIIYIYMYIYTPIIYCIFTYIHLNLMPGWYETSTDARPSPRTTKLLQWWRSWQVSVCRRCCPPSTKVKNP